MFAFKVILLIAAAYASGAHAGIIPYAHSSDSVASTHQNVVRSYDGTVSQYSKAIDTPYTSVRKEDTRVSNNVYHQHGGQVYQAQAVPAVYEHHETVPANAAVYEHHHHQPQPQQQQQQHYVPAPTVATYAAPSLAYSAPAVTKTVSYAAPAPAAVYSHAAPVVYSHPVAKTVSYETQAPQVYHQEQHHEVPVTSYNHGPSASTTYSHNTPGVAAYGSAQTVRFSPAEMVSHMSFDGFGAHYGF